MSSLQPDTLISLLALPDHLRETMIVAQIHGQVTAQDVTKETKKSRVRESINLNQLARMGLLHKELQGHQKKGGPHAVFMTKTKEANPEINSLYQKLRRLSREVREMICEDMLTAFENRVKVFSNLRKDN